jgi:hypothetical protein
MCCKLQPAIDPAKIRENILPCFLEDKHFGEFLAYYLAGNYSRIYLKNLKPKDMQFQKRLCVFDNFCGEILKHDSH